MTDTKNPAPQPNVEPRMKFAEWFNAGPEVATASGFAIEITAISAAGSALKLTSAEFEARAALATEGSAPDYSEAASGYNSPPHLIAEDTAPQNNVATRLVIVESPFAGDIDENVAYARAALRDCLDRGEAPYASHLLYTQPGVLDDTDADQRRHGIEAGLAWGRMASATVVYTDLGISPGMKQGIDRARLEGRQIEFRSINGGGECRPSAKNGSEK